MPTTSLTPEEVHFLDQYVRELHLGAGVATKQLHERDIFYSPTLFGNLTYLWDQNWRFRSQEFPYPQKDDLGVLCPWESNEQLEARIKELQNRTNV
jgi:hypothetical protein